MTVSAPRRVESRHLLGVIALVAALGFVVLAVRVWHGVGPLRFDERVQAGATSRYSDADDRSWLNYLSYPGRPQAVVVESLLLAMVVWRYTRERWVALFCAVVPIAVGVGAELLLKPIIDRRNVSGEGLLFPSGHTTGIASVAVAAWITWLSLSPSRPARIVGGVALAAVVALVGVSRVLLHTHYVTDVVGGALYAAAATVALAFIWPKVFAPELSDY